MLCGRSFEAMGTVLRLHVRNEGSADAGELLLDRAAARIEDLEQRWSRFLPDSELSQINASGGNPVVVSDLTFDLVAAAIAAYHLTEGCFDPTVLGALEAAGYDRPFAEGLDSLPTHAVGDRSTARVQTPGPSAVSLDRFARMITLDADCRLDLGGIAKGATADLVASEVLGAGATGVSISIGGDVRAQSVQGSEPWPVALSVDPTAAPIELLDGSVCTSSRRRRTWMFGTEPVHHLIDPRTGRSFAGSVVEVAVVAGNALTAEILTKVVFGATAADADAILAAHGATAVVLDDAGELQMLGHTPMLNARTPMCLEAVA